MGNQMGKVNILGHCRQITSIGQFVSQVPATWNAITAKNVLLITGLPLQATGSVP